MAEEQNKAAIRRFYEEVFHQGKLNVIDEIVAADFVEHAAPPGVPPTIEGLKGFVASFRSAFPDGRFTIEDEIAAGDRAMARTIFRGTHKGEFMGIPATGKTVTVSGIDIVRFGPNGKAVEHWANQDDLGMMQQLGVIPPSGQPGS